MKTIKIHYEARLSRSITRSPYGGKKVYKKGTLIWNCSETEFKILTYSNIHTHRSIAICEGHGVYQYFDLQTDIEFFKVEIVAKTKETKVKLKK